MDVDHQKEEECNNSSFKLIIVENLISEGGTKKRWQEIDNLF